MRVVIALLVLAHGFAHVAGLAGSWQIGTGIPRKTTLLGGRVDLGEAGMRAFGLVWLVGAMGFAAAGGALLLAEPIWMTLLLAAAVFSLTISLLALPDAHVGVWVNVALLAFVHLAARFHWLAE